MTVDEDNLITIVIRDEFGNEIVDVDIEEIKISTTHGELGDVEFNSEDDNYTFTFSAETPDEAEIKVYLGDETEDKLLGEVTVKVDVGAVDEANSHVDPHEATDVVAGEEQEVIFTFKDSKE